MDRKSTKIYNSEQDKYEEGLFRKRRPGGQRVGHCGQQVGHLQSTSRTLRSRGRTLRSTRSKSAHGGGGIWAILIYTWLSSVANNLRHISYSGTRGQQRRPNWPRRRRAGQGQAGGAFTCVANFK